MKTEIRELHEALSKSFKIHIVTKIIEIVGGIGLVIQMFSDSNLNWFWHRH
jgi:hypothetical protein